MKKISDVQKSIRGRTKTLTDSIFLKLY